jgi:hypothetical protein
MMRIHVTDPLDPVDDSAIDQPVLLTLAAAAKAKAVAAFAEEDRLADVLHADELARHRHRRSRRGLVSKLRG